MTTVIASEGAAAWWTTLIDAVFDVALAGTDAEMRARKETLWIIGVTLLADVLLRTDQLGRERLLRGLERELRDAMAGITQNMTRRLNWKRNAA
jgi:hypothetical protein